MSYSASLRTTQPYSTRFIQTQFNGVHNLSKAHTVYCRSSNVKKATKAFDIRSAPAETPIRYFDYLLQCVGLALAFSFCLAKPNLSFPLDIHVSFLRNQGISVDVLCQGAVANRTLIRRRFIINSPCTICDGFCFVYIIMMSSACPCNSRSYNPGMTILYHALAILAH